MSTFTTTAAVRQEVVHVPALDGLRAVACLAVIAHHLGVLPGGWLGVDVFFVLSGYLITTLLLAEVEREGAISLGRFYVRRAGRLYPALLLTVAGCVVEGLTVEWVSIGATDVLAAVLYLTDLRPMDTWAHPLSHVWSLAVEEQFYLLWPLVVLVLRTRRRIAIGAAVGGACSLAAMVFLTLPSVGTPDTYVYPHTRAWGLLIGCLLATLPRTRWAAAHVWGGLVGIAAAFGGATVFGVGHTGPLLAAECLSASVAAAATIRGAVCLPDGPSLLTSRLMEWIGKRTYGMYLFHVPLVLLVAPLPPALRVVPVAAATARTAALSFAWVEQPVRAWARRKA